MAQIPTVNIQGDVAAGEPACITINEADYDPKLHKLYTDQEAAPAKHLSKMNKVELAAVAESLGIVVPEDATNRQLLALIEAAAAKDDI